MIATLYRGHLDVLRRRTDRVLDEAGFDALAVHSGAPAMKFLDDQPYSFTANPHFRAWVPIAAPHSWLMYRPGHRPTVVFYQPSDYWHSTPATPTEHWVDEVDLIVVSDVEAARQYLPGGRVAAIGEPGRMPEWVPARNPDEVLIPLHYERAVKTPYEIACMRLASERGVRGHRAAAQAFHDGGSEFAIHIAYLRGTGHTEADLPYPNIIALNEHAAVLHHTELATEAPGVRRSFLIDAGAAFRGYACDITRTHAASDADGFAELIDAVDRLQQRLADQVRPGTDYAGIHLEAHRGLAAILEQAGIIRLAPDDAVSSGLSAIFFPHGVGHLIGLQVHDVAGLTIDRHGTEKPRPDGHPYLRLTRTLEPGFVVTIEPGVYFIPLLLEQARTSGLARHIDWDRIERLLPYGGVRIEDDVVCTDGEPENLTRNAWQESAG